MSDTTSAAAGNTQWQWPAFLVMCAWLTSSVLWRLLVPAHEYSMRREQVLTMVLDGILIIGLLGTWRRISVPDKAEVLRHFRDALFLVALLSGIGLFVHPLDQHCSMVDGAPVLLAKLNALNGRGTASNPLIKQVDANPFMPMAIGKTISASLAALAASIH